MLGSVVMADAVTSTGALCSVASCALWKAVELWLVEPGKHVWYCDCVPAWDAPSCTAAHLLHTL